MTTTFSRFCETGEALRSRLRRESCPRASLRGAVALLRVRIVHAVAAALADFWVGPALRLRDALARAALWSFPIERSMVLRVRAARRRFEVSALVIGAPFVAMMNDGLRIVDADDESVLALSSTRRDCHDDVAVLKMSTSAPRRIQRTDRSLRLHVVALSIGSTATNFAAAAARAFTHASNYTTWDMTTA